VPVTLSPGAAPWLELLVDVVPMGRVWSLRNGSTSLGLLGGSGMGPWAIGMDFEISVGDAGDLERRVVTVTHASDDLMHFTPAWRGAEVLSGVPSGNVTSLPVRNATYEGDGNNTDTLVFEYTVLPGDRTGRLDYTSSKAFKMSPNSTLLRLAHHPSTIVNTTLVAPGDCSASKEFGCSLSSNDADDTAVEIEARSQVEFRPKVLRVTTTKPGDQSPYGAGEPIDVVVTFNVPVAVQSNGSAAPVLRLSPGGFAVYGYGSGTNNLTFWYVVGEGDSADVLESYARGYANGFDAFADHLSPLDIFFLGQGQGWIRRDSSRPLTPANLALPPPGSEGSLSALQPTAAERIRICTVSCAFVEVVVSTLPPGTNCGVGDELPIVVRFNRRVFVNTSEGLPFVQLRLGAPATDRVGAREVEEEDLSDVRRAYFVNGSGERGLLFVYVVQAGDPYTDPVQVHQRSADLSRTTTVQRNGASITTAGTGDDAVLTIRRISRQHALPALNLDMTTSHSSFGASAPFSPDPSRSLMQQGIIVDSDPPTVHTVEAVLAPWTKTYG